jgi:hypothetical protein
MGNLGLGDWLSLAQTAGIVASLVLTLYFARRQVQAMTQDIESRVLNDLDEKRYRISELLIEKPSLISVVAGPGSGSRPEHVISYMVALASAHAYHMRERKLIGDNEWVGWREWIRNDFAQGTVGRDWVELKLGQWFDPSFREWIDRDVLGSAKGTDMRDSAGPDARQP